jgi:hypothetical protein
MLLCGSQVVVAGTTVQDVARNGLKLWRGGDVQDCIVNGTGADAALVGESGGPEVERFRYLRTTITRHNPNQEAYVGTWAYGVQEAIDVEFTGCTFQGNSIAGGLYFPNAPGTKLKFTNNVFYDRGRKLIDYGGVGDVIMTDEAGIRELESRGWGSGNRMGGV